MTPNNIERGPEQKLLSEKERAEATQFTQTILIGVDQAREDLSRRILGDQAYERGRALMEIMINPPVIDLPEDLQALSDEQHAARGESRAREVLSLEPLDKNEEQIKMMMQHWARSYFPNDTILSILDSPEKLARLGLHLIYTEDSVRAQNQPDYRKLEDVYIEIDELIQKLYNQEIGLNHSELEVNVDSISSHITRSETEKESHLSIEKRIAAIDKNSESIAIKDGRLFLNKEPVINYSQLAAVKAVLGPFKTIVPLLLEDFQT